MLINVNHTVQFISDDKTVASLARIEAKLAEIKDLISDESELKALLKTIQEKTSSMDEALKPSSS